MKKCLRFGIVFQEKQGDLGDCRKKISYLSGSCKIGICGGDGLEYVEINGHKIHIFRAGVKDGPRLVFMSGSGTIAPVYDFKILYEKLVSD